MATRNFHNSNKKTKYGEHDVKFWIGTVAGYASQEKQLESGFGWMYKVRIDGDHSNDKNKVKDDQLSYAYCILPTTAGSGAAFKLRSARVSQGDTVFGLRGGGVGAPAFIIGVFPRTRETVFATTTEIKNGKKSGGLTGFYGSLNGNTGILSGEFNDQIGPATPGTDPVGPKNYSKAEKKEPSDKSEQLGVVADSDEEVNVEENLTPPVKVQTSEDYNESVQKGEIVVKNEETLENVTEGGLNGDIDPTVAIVANETAVKENVIEESVAEENIRELEKKKDKFDGEKMVEVKNPEGEIILLPESVVKKGFSFQSELEKEAEQFEVGGSRYEEVHSSSSTDDSESKETFTSSSSVNITYDEDTNTFSSSTVTTSSSSISGLVVGSEAPNTDTDIKLRLQRNIMRVNYFINLYNSPNYTGDRNAKIAEANNYISQLRSFINSNPSGYDGSSLQATLKSNYTGITY